MEEVQRVEFLFTLRLSLNVYDLETKINIETNMAHMIISSEIQEAFEPDCFF